MQAMFPLSLSPHSAKHSPHDLILHSFGWRPSASSTDRMPPSPSQWPHCGSHNLTVLSPPTRARPCPLAPPPAARKTPTRTVSARLLALAASQPASLPSQAVYGKACFCQQKPLETSPSLPFPPACGPFKVISCLFASYSAASFESHKPPTSGGQRCVGDDNAILARPFSRPLLFLPPARCVHTAGPLVGGSSERSELYRRTPYEVWLANCGWLRREHPLRPRQASRRPAGM